MQSFNYLIPIASFILGVLGYERVVRKDSNSGATNMAILMTKVDMLLNNSNEVKKEIKEHSKLINEHEIKIKDLEDTIRFNRPNMKEFKEG